MHAGAFQTAEYTGHMDQQYVGIARHLRGYDIRYRYEPHEGLHMNPRNTDHPLPLPRNDHAGILTRDYMMARGVENLGDDDMPLTVSHEMLRRPDLVPWRQRRMDRCCSQCQPSEVML